MNIIFLSLESTRSDHFGPEADLDTPTVDRLCEEGEYFPNTFVHLPHTGNHGSIMTGMLPKNTGIRTLGGALDDMDMPTAFSIFNDDDYRVKTHLGSGMLKDRGFTEWGLSGSDSLQEVTESIEEIGDDEFFLLIHYWNTHTPYRTELPVEGPKDFLANLSLKVQDKIMPRGYMGRYDRPMWKEMIRYPFKYFWEHRQKRVREIIRTHPQRVKEGYRRSIEEADRYIEDLLKHLEKEDILDETVLVIFGDHGESLNEHNEREETSRYTHGSFLYDNVVNVPLVIWSNNPDLMKEGKTREKIARSIDILPTVLDLSNTDSGSEFDGVNLFESSPEYAYAEAHEGVEKAMIRTQNMKLIRDFEKSEDMVFNLENDPEETENIAESKRSFIDEKTPIMEDFMGDFKDQKEEEEIKSRLKNLGYRD